MTAMIECRELVRIFSSTGVEVQALQGLDLTVEPGELTAVVGASGSGKSTLLTILSGLDVPSAGRARVSGHDLLTMGRRERIEYRRRTVGFIWQQTVRNLLPYLTAAENISLALVVADEPTGELDEANSEMVLEAFRAINETLGTTVLIVTHDAGVSDHVRRTVQIRDGRTSTEVLRSTRTDSAGLEHEVAEEFAVLDRVGRLQLPLDYIAQLDMRDRVRLGLTEEHVTVSPVRAESEVPPDSEAPAGPEAEARG